MISRMATSEPVNHTSYYGMDNEEFKNYVKKRFSENVRYPSSLPPGNESKVTNSFLDTDVYIFDHPHRGLAIIINNQSFHTPGILNREGSQVDEEALKECLSRLGFDVEIFMDLTSEQMLIVTTAAASQYGHQDADCLVVAILTHGCEIVRDLKNNKFEKRDALYGTDGTLVEVKAIVDCFDDENCPSLINKPRLFFIQADRGDKLDDGVFVRDLDAENHVATVEASKHSEPEATKLSISDPVGMRDKTMISRPVILYADCLIMYASPPGYVAWRSPRTGSWFIQELCKFLNSDNVGDISFVRGLTSVCRKVAVQYESSTNIPGMSGKKSIPVVESSLLNEIYMTRHKGD